MSKESEACQSRQTRHPNPFSLFFLLQQGEVLVQFGLDFLHPLICISGGGVQLLLQQTQADAGLAEFLSL